VAGKACNVAYAPPRPIANGAPNESNAPRLLFANQVGQGCAVQRTWEMLDREALTGDQPPPSLTNAQANVDVVIAVRSVTFVEASDLVERNAPKRHVAAR
jgi:hypothetical protein